MIVWQAHEGNLSGANIAMLEYIDALQANYRSHVILPHEGNMCKEITDRAVSLSIIPQYGWAGTSDAGTFVKRIKRSVRTYIAVNAIKQLLVRTKPVFVFSNTLVTFAAAKAAYQLGLSHVWWIHEYGEEDFGFVIGNGNSSNAFRKMRKWSKLIICNSEAVKRKFQILLPNVSVERIYQPVSWQSIDCRINPDGVEYLMFGQIVASKGHIEVIEAIALSRKKGHLIRLDIKGPCEDIIYLGNLQKLIRKHGLSDQISLEVGFFVKELVIPAYKVLIVASRSEAFGRVIVEATKAGLKVIVKNSGGAPELVNEKNGKLYKTTEELSAIFDQEIIGSISNVDFNYNEAMELLRLHQLLASIK